jgi:hypothetical protein
MSNVMTFNWRLMGVYGVFNNTIYGKFYKEVI